MTVEQAIAALGEIIREALQPRNIGIPEPRVKLNGYLNWVHCAQLRLRSIFADSEREDSLLARACWHVSMSSIPLARSLAGS